MGRREEILGQILDVIPQCKHPEWIKEVEEYRKVSKTLEFGGFNPRTIIEEVNKHMDPDTVVATDVGQHQMWTMQYYKFEKPHTLLSSGGLGTMGYGLGAAIGGCFASGK